MRKFWVEWWAEFPMPYKAILIVVGGYCVAGQILDYFAKEALKCF